MKYLKKYESHWTDNIFHIKYKKEDLIDLFLELKDDYNFNYDLITMKTTLQPNSKTLPNLYIKGNLDKFLGKFEFNKALCYKDNLNYDAFILNVHNKNEEITTTAKELGIFLETKEDILDSLGLKIQNLYIPIGSGNYKQIKMFLITAK